MTEEEINLHIGKRIKRRRRLMFLTATQLGALMDLSLQQVGKYEIGANRIRAATLLRFAETLNVPITYFYDGLTAKVAQESTPANG